MICDDCIKKDVCIYLKNLNELNIGSNMVKLGIIECPHKSISCKIENTNKLELPTCELCGEKCYERFICKECGKKVCIDCAAEYEINDFTEEVECICDNCAENEELKKEKTETEKLIDELF